MSAQNRTLLAGARSSKTLSIQQHILTNCYKRNRLNFDCIFSKMMRNYPALVVDEC